MTFFSYQKDKRKKLRASLSKDNTLSEIEENWNEKCGY
jgi:hypothetical protein